MGSLLRVKLRWSGFIGSPGYSVFHFLQDGQAGDLQTMADAATDLVADFAVKVKDLLPAIGALQVMSDVEEIAESDGKMLNVVSAKPHAATTSTAAAFEGYAGPTGAVVNWRTAGVRNGRRVHGKTFLVPLTSGAFENNGTLKAYAITAIQSAADEMVTGAFNAPNFGVYARPTSKGATDGIFWEAKAGTVPDFAAVLRSRRD